MRISATKFKSDAGPSDAATRVGARGDITLTGTGTLRGTGQLVLVQNITQPDTPLSTLTAL